MGRVEGVRIVEHPSETQGVLHNEAVCDVRRV